MNTQNHSTPEGSLAPTAACQRFASLIAAFTELREINDRQTPDTHSDLAQARDHLATCAYCQREVRIYARLDVAVRSALNAAPLAPLSTEEIMQNLIGSSNPLNSAQTCYEEASSETTDAEQASFAPINTGANIADGAMADREDNREADQDDQVDHVEYSPLPRQSPPTISTRLAGIRRRARRASAALWAVAAVVIVALLLVGVFRAVDFSHRHSPASTHKNNTPSFLSPYPTAIALTSPTDGWIAGVDNQVYDAAHSSLSDGYIFFLHEQHGAWTPIQTGIAASGDFEGSPSPPAAIISISMDSSADGWAAGTWGMLLHYDGHTWQRVAGPNSFSESNGAPYYGALQMLSPTNGWLIDSNGSPGREIFHYDGHAWAPQILPASLSDGASVSVALQGLEMLPTGEGWAVGALQPILQAGETATPTPSGLILHYLNGRWSVQAILKGMTLRSISMTSSGEGWAVGNRDQYVNLPGEPSNLDAQTPVIVHFSHGQWTPIADPLVSYYTPTDPYLDTGQFTQVKMLSPSNGWIAGQSTAPLQYQGDYAFSDTLLMHYNGVAWRLVTLPPIKVQANDEFASANLLDFASNGDGWLVGVMYPSYQHGVRPINRILLYRYHAGVWSVAQR